MKEDIKTTLPIFGGFYESLEDSILDDAFKFVIESLKEAGTAEDLLDDAGEHVRWRELMLYVSEKAVKVVNRRIERFCGVAEACEFETLWSPSFYNYTTDEIQITLKREAFDAIRRKLDAECTATIAIEEAFRADCDGDAREEFYRDLYDATFETLYDKIGTQLDNWLQNKPIAA